MFNFIVGVVNSNCKYKENILRTFKTREDAEDFGEWFSNDTKESEKELIERFNYTPYDCEHCYYYIEDEEKTCNNLYEELKDIADNVERIRLKLYTNNYHREWNGVPGEEDFEMVDSKLFKIQSDLRRLKAFLLMEDD